MVAKVWQGIDRRIILLVVLLIGVGAVLNVAVSEKETKSVTAMFPRAVSVYKGTDVRILGVNVGEVTSVTPAGNAVRVEMEYDAEYDVPADAQAVIVTPTLVADRFVQLTPVYEKGPVLADDATIELPDTGVPVELDRIYASLQALTRALGPNGVNKDGSLNHLLRAGRNALEGQGAAGNEMIRELALAAETFGDGAGPLFETVTNLAAFTTTLADNDALVRAFMRDLAGVSRTLAAESDELQQAVAAVADAVGSVESFVRDNRDGLSRDIRQLSTVMSAIASEKDNLRTRARDRARRRWTPSTWASTTSPARRTPGSASAATSGRRTASSAASPTEPGRAAGPQGHRLRPDHPAAEPDRRQPAAAAPRLRAVRP